ncbi:EI24 domain-containing protein [Streptantibioticus silvisoli]|uniref:EI24 domain-containing protein n=1 Tax=Streptantibioticus silvisoli TaxID=2705255 RepID=A0ABT6VSP1_9ACTN|nr:EI24 domain-containing protein [Streptantibioticus silvisoli]MDI5961497.1 EI24 domain-containing protein [Streptantibioticus silvisoli]
MRGLRDLWTGLRFAAEGQRWIARHGRLWAWSAIPALITLAGYVVALTALLLWGGHLIGWLTPFASTWPGFWRELLRWTLRVLLFGGVLLLAVVSFTAVTLVVGQPFYETLSGRVETSESGTPPPRSGLPMWRELLLGVRESAALLLRMAAFGVPLFLLGFVPLLGQTAVPVAGFCVSGFFLTHELTMVAFQRRRIPLRDRLRLLRSRLGLALGFGVPLVLLFLVPFVAVVAMPGAVAGATLLARDLLEQSPFTPDPDADPDRRPGPGDAPAPGGDRTPQDGPTA